MAYNNNNGHPPYISNYPDQRFHDYYGNSGLNSSINLVNLDVSTSANDSTFTFPVGIQESESWDILRELRVTKKLDLKLTMDDPLLLKVLTPPPATIISSTNAFHFNALSIQIGSWKVSERDAVLVCKGYPSKTSFAWEILKFGRQQCKYRIKFEWSDIQDIKLNKFPLKGSQYLFFKLKSKPKIEIERSEITGRKHTKWMKTDYDFTANDQASSSSSNNTKEHRIEIKAGVLEKYYHSIMKAHPDPDYYPYSYRRMPTPYPEPSFVPNGPLMIHPPRQLPTTSVHEAASSGVDDSFDHPWAEPSLVPNMLNGSSSLMIHPPRQLPTTSLHGSSSGGVDSFENDAIIDHPWAGPSIVSNIINGSPLSSLMIHPPPQLSSTSVDEASSSGVDPNNYNNGLLQNIVAGVI